MHRLALLLLFACLVPAGRAQTGPLPGMVWQPPAAFDLAAADLRHMHRLGVRAIRTVPLDDERLFALADTLGLVFYQELPVQYATGPELEQASGPLLATLANVMARSARFASGRVVGLARRPDTSDPRACAVLDALARRAHAAHPGARVYYVAALWQADRCAERVDFVLLPLLDAPRPLDDLRRWQQEHPRTPAGLVVGWWSDGARRGRHAAHSPEWAAAHLDTLLASLPGLPAPAAPLSVFVYRWRDGPASPLDLHAPQHRGYGLMDTRGHTRPTYTVAQGWFTASQRVFALRGGSPSPLRSADGPRLLAWLALLLLGIGMALDTRFRQMAHRYFRARGFYRESIRDARGALTGTALVLLPALGLCFGIIATSFVGALATSPAFSYAAYQVGPGARQALVGLVQHPWTGVLAGAALFVLLHLLTAAAYVLAVRRRTGVGFLQVLVLDLWSRWPFVLLAFAALVVETLPAPRAAEGALAVGAFALALSLLATARSLLDLLALGRVPAYVLGALLLLHPAVLALLVAALAFFDYGAAMRFFYLLARQGLA